MRRLFFTLLVFLPILGICKDLNDNHTPLQPHSPIMKRPLVTLVPILNSSENSFSWSVATSLYQSIRKNLEMKKSLYLTDEDSLSTKIKRMICKHDPFGLDTDWIKKAFQQNEFIVFTELLDHKEIPLDAKFPQDSSAELRLAVRIRVFDIRSQTPRVILQEIVRKFHQIPKQFNQYNFTQVPPDNKAFEISPLGMIYEMVCQDACNNIEDYILLAGN
jgi:hypothetical protein